MNSGCRAARIIRSLLPGATPRTSREAPPTWQYHRDEPANRRKAGDLGDRHDAENDSDYEKAPYQDPTGGRPSRDLNVTPNLVTSQNNTQNDNR